MQADRTDIVGAIPTARSAMTNGTRVQLFGDQRSAGARRFRDLMVQFAADFGGVEKVSIAGLQTIRRASQVSVELELLEATRAAGGAIDVAVYGTLANLQARLLRALEREKLACEVDE